jgi:hypothetical protein
VNENPDREIPEDGEDERDDPRPPGRRWCIPPAITTEPGESVEGLKILDEFPEEVAFALWQSLREVTLWASLEPGQRVGYVNDTLDERLVRLQRAGLEPEVEVAVAALAATLRTGTPADPPTVSSLCSRISDWAEGRGSSATTLHFAQAAALADPRSATAAVRIGDLALRAGQLPRGETWLRRAIGIARRARAWDAYVCACIGLGHLALEHQLRPRLAERWFQRAERVSRRAGLRALAAQARHGLLLVHLGRGDLETGGRHPDRRRGE